MHIAGIDVVILDFDGVILESVDIKTEAFRALFQEHPEHVEAVAAYHRLHGGVSRREKLIVMHRDILGCPLAPDGVDAWCDRFAAIVLQQVLACPFVPGARAFLARHADVLPLFVASGTPQDELRRIVAKRDLGRYFQGVYGSPATKTAIAADILARCSCPPGRAVLVGDSITDAQAAASLGLRFVGRVPPGEASPFAGNPPLVADLATLTFTKD